MASSEKLKTKQMDGGQFGKEKKLFSVGNQTKLFADEPIPLLMIVTGELPLPAQRQSPKYQSSHLLTEHLRRMDSLQTVGVWK